MSVNLGEFQSAVDTVLAALEICKTIADNTSVDTIDMTGLVFDFPTLTDMAFGVQSNIIMTQSIARKEAYDFMAGYTRLATVYSRTRSDYYSGADAEIDKGIEQINYLKGVLTSLEQFIDR